MLFPALASADKTFDTEKTGTWDCSKDATVVINKSTGKYTLTGACKEITINGGHLTVAIESVGTLTVKATAARQGVRPGTSERIQIPAGKKVSFKVASDLKKNL